MNQETLTGRRKRGRFADQTYRFKQLVKAIETMHPEHVDAIYDLSCVFLDGWDHGQTSDWFKEAVEDLQQATSKVNPS